MQRHHATVSVVHAFTKNPEEITREADILVSDVGVPNLVRGNWLKPGVVVIDMGSTLVKVDFLIRIYLLDELCTLQCSYFRVLLLA